MVESIDRRASDGQWQLWRTGNRYIFRHIYREIEILPGTVSTICRYGYAADRRCDVIHYCNRKEFRECAAMLVIRLDADAIDAGRYGCGVIGTQRVSTDIKTCIVGIARA